MNRVTRLSASALSVILAFCFGAVAYAERSDDDPSVEQWGKDFPEYVEMYMKTRDMSNPTAFGGNVPYSKLIRFPGKTALWGGYAFAVDFNEERGHFYSQIDQMETKRNDKAYLNAHGLVNFKGQPGACMNCHSGWAPKLIRDMGWEAFNRTPYWDTIGQLRKKHGHGTDGAQLGSTCADCHHPADMSLRVTRPAYINAMVARGYEADPEKGLKGTNKEMRDHVCQQCHVEYYFKGANAVLTYPWTQWPKGKPLAFEMIEAYYEIERNKPDGFKADWTHNVTKAPMLKMQHPEAELASSGPHAKMGVGCVDCHMPKVDYKGKKVTDHTISSAYNKLESCQTCHNVSQDEIKQMVYNNQVRTAAHLLTAEKAILALIQDIAMVRGELVGKKPFKDISSGSERDAAISKELTDTLNAHRRASMRWDWVGASNSTGAHSPGEALRVLKQAVDIAREGQGRLKAVADKHSIKLVLTTEPVHPEAPDPIEPGNIVGSLPPKITRKADQDVKAYMKKM